MFVFGIGSVRTLTERGARIHPKAKEAAVAKVVVVTSGKGGVGKTTTSASIAAGIAMRGYKTVVIDFDVGLRNLDLIMGCERRVVYDLVNVVKGEARLHQALIKDKRVDNLFVLPASQTRDKDSLDIEGVHRVISELAKKYDYVICDSPAGIERGAQMAMYFADEAIVVSNPEVSAVRDCDRVLGLLDAKTYRAEHNLEPIKPKLLLTRYNPQLVKAGEMLSVDDVLELLGIPFLGVIPESRHVLNASNAGTPVILDDSTDAGQAYMDVVLRFLGEERPHRFMDVQKKGLLRRIFG
jgi:septum site-determining protein MinD